MASCPLLPLPQLPPKQNLENPKRYLGQEFLDALFRYQFPIDLHPLSEARHVGGHEQARFLASLLQ